MRIDFTQENKSKSTDRYEKLTLKKDEVARVCILEAPELFYVHTLNMPVVDPTTGEVQKITKQTSKGDEYEADAMEFVGTTRCSGDVAAVRENEIDPENCPLCKAVAEHPSKFVKPDPKYASHVIKYKVQHGTATPQTPFQCELLLWILTQRKFDEIIGIAADFGSPLSIDLKLGPCISGTYQNYQIAAAGGQAFWQQDQTYVNHVKQLFDTNAASPDQVADTVAYSLQATRAAADVQKVLDRYASIGRASATPMPTEFGGGAVATELQNMWDRPATQPAPDFSMPTPQQPPAVQQPQQQPSWSEAPPPPLSQPSFADDAQPVAQQPVQEQVQQQPVQEQAQPVQQPVQEQPPAQNAGQVDFATLLNQVNQQS